MDWKYLHIPGASPYYARRTQYIITIRSKVRSYKSKELTYYQKIYGLTKVKNSVFF